MRFRPSIVALALVLLTPAGAAAQDPLWGVGVDDALDGPPTLAPTLARVTAGAWTHPLHLRLIVRREALEPAPGQYEFAALDARIALYRDHPGLGIWIDLRARAPEPAALEAWTRVIGACARRYRGVVRGYILGAGPPEAPRPAPGAHAFALKAAAIEIQAVDRNAAVVLGGIREADAAWLEALFDEDLAPYVDAVGLAPDDIGGRIPALLDRRDPRAALVVLGAPLGDLPADAARRFTMHHVRILGTRVSGATYAAPAPVIDAALPAVAFLRDLIDQPLTTLDQPATGVRLGRAGLDQTAAIPHRVLFGLTTAAMYLIYESAEALDLVITEPTGTRPVIRDAVRLSRRPTAAFAYDAAARRASIALPGDAWPLVLDWGGESPARIARSEVTTEALPTLAEIIARHQRAQAAQDEALTSYVAEATMTQHFRPTTADSGFDIVTENRFFVEGRQTEFEERSFQLNGTRWGANRPPFPLLQAEKVLSLPLDLRLTSDYRYRFEGVERIEDRECFVIRFDPVGDDQTLYRGTVWIDRQTYLRAQVETVQTRMGAPVLSSEETQRFGQVGTVAGRAVVLLTELVGRQNILIAGRSLLVERRLAFRDFQLNPADFDAMRLAARRDDHLMFRDTDRGLRPLVMRDGDRVVDDRTTTHAKAMLIGVTIDPAYDFPLPLGGLNYLDFEFAGPDSQLAVLFAGVLALVNVQRPQLLGGRVDGSVDLFAIAVPGSDRTYDAQGERPGERVRTLPFTTGANLGWRATERTRLTVSYQFRFDGYFREPVTSADFEPPPSTSTHGLGLAVEWRRAGYSLAAGWSGFRRTEWQAWGAPGDYQAAHRDYSRRQASLSKDFFSGVHKVRLNAAYYGGHDLDRFSQYQFGFFDEHRIRGVPSAGVRFDALGMVRASYAFNLFDQYRAELAFDHAYGRDRRIGRNWQRITGVGVGFLTRGPRQTMLRGDIGKSFLPDRYRRPGSWVLQIQVLKPL